MTAGDMRIQAGDMWKYQCAFWPDDADDNRTDAGQKMKDITDRLARELDIVRISSEGTFLTLTARGEKEKILAKLNEENPCVLNEIPMSLEEIFIAEMEVKGYDIRKVLH